jgi:hypothetical protein
MKLIAIFLFILIFGVGTTILGFFLIAKLRRHALADFIYKNIWIFIVSSAVITGAVCQNLFLFCFLGVGTALAVLLTLIGFISDLFTKTNKGIRLTGFIFLFFFISATTSVASLKISEQLATSLANKIITSIYNYKQKNGRLPLSVEQLQINKATIKKFKLNQTYLLDSSKQNFQIESWSDG